MPDNLTLKQRKFVEAYVGAANGNATKAAKQAGYSERSAHSVGHETLKKPEVREAIEARLAENTLGRNEVLSRLSDIARGSLDDFIGVGAPDLSDEAEQLLSMFIDEADSLFPELRGMGALPLGLPELLEQRREELQALGERLKEATHSRPWRFDLERAEKAGLLHLIAEIGTTDGGATRLKLHDRVRALELIGKYHRLFVERQEHTGLNGGPLQVAVAPNLTHLSDEELEALERLCRKVGSDEAAEPGGDPGGAGPA